MNLYDIINHRGEHREATFAFYAILINAVRSAKRGDFESMHDFLTQWDGAVSMYNSMLGYYESNILTFDEDRHIKMLVRKVLKKNY